MTTKRRTAPNSLPVAPPPQDPASAGPATVESKIKEGNAAFSEKDYDRALSLYREAFAIDSHDPAIMAKVATAYYKLRDFKNAVTYFQNALEILPKDKDLLFTLGMVYVKMGDKTSALGVYDKLKKVREDKAEDLYKAIYS